MGVFVFKEFCLRQNSTPGKGIFMETRGSSGRLAMGKSGTSYADKGVPPS
jgi:hypothetical protein